MAVADLYHNIFRAGFWTHDSCDGHRYLGRTAETARHRHVTQRYNAIIRHGLATTLSGFIITQDGAGEIVGYATVGYITIMANVLAILFVSRIVMHHQNRLCFCYDSPTPAMAFCTNVAEIGPGSRAPVVGNAGVGRRQIAARTC